MQTTCKNITFFRQSIVPKATIFHSSIFLNDSKFACSSAPSPIGGDTFSIVDGVYFHSGEAPLARTHRHCFSTQLPRRTQHTQQSSRHTNTHARTKRQQQSQQLECEAPTSQPEEIFTQTSEGGTRTERAKGGVVGLRTTASRGTSSFVRLHFFQTARNATYAVLRGTSSRSNHSRYGPLTIGDTRDN